MNYEVRVKFSSGPGKIVRGGEGRYEVTVNEKPVENKANEAVLRSLADHLGIARTRLRIIRGTRSRTKYINVL